MSTRLYGRPARVMVRWQQRKRQYVRERCGLGCLANVMFEVKIMVLLLLTSFLDLRGDNWKMVEGQWSNGFGILSVEGPLGMASLGKCWKMKSRSQFRSWGEGKKDGRAPISACAGTPGATSVHLRGWRGRWAQSREEGQLQSTVREANRTLTCLKFCCKYRQVHCACFELAAYLKRLKSPC